MVGLGLYLFSGQRDSTNYRTRCSNAHLPVEPTNLEDYTPSGLLTKQEANGGIGPPMVLVNYGYAPI